MTRGGAGQHDRPRDRAVVKIDGGAVVIDGGSTARAMVDGAPRVVELEPGPHRVQVNMSDPGYGELAEEFTVAAGDVVTARAELPMLWGNSGRLRTAA